MAFSHLACYRTCLSTKKHEMEQKSKTSIHMMRNELRIHEGFGHGKAGQILNGLAPGPINKGRLPVVVRYEHTCTNHFVMNGCGKRSTLLRYVFT